MADFGAGTGILSIAGILFGVKEVFSYEID